MHGERMRELREKKGMDLGETAKIFNVSKPTLSCYENKKRRPNIEFLIEFAQFFETSVDYILGLTDDPRPRNADYNFKLYLENKSLNWDGEPLTDEELQPIKDLLTVVVRDRLKSRKKSEGHRHAV